MASKVAANARQKQYRAAWRGGGRHSGQEATLAPLCGRCVAACSSAAVHGGKGPAKGWPRRRRRVRNDTAPHEVLPVRRRQWPANRTSSGKRAGPRAPDTGAPPAS
jgi:hypothetical protein